MDKENPPRPGEGGPIGRIYTVAEAAPLLGMGRRKLETLLREFPFFTPNGNRKLLNDDDIKELWKVRRVRVPTPSVLEHRGGRFIMPTLPGEDPYADLREQGRKEKEARRAARNRPRR